MTIADARKLKPGDVLRLKADGSVLVVTGREDSGHTIYVTRHGSPYKAVSNLEVRKEMKG